MMRMVILRALLVVPFAGVALCSADHAAAAPRSSAQGAPTNAAAAEDAHAKSGAFGFAFNPGAENLPTLIKSDSLRLETEKRVFTYSGNVAVVHGELTMTSNELVGTYSEKNEVEQLDAQGDVIILRGETMRGTAQNAHYDAKSATVVLTDNPELQENGSVLTADKITVYLNENRSVADGEVRVRLIKNEEEKK